MADYTIQDYAQLNNGKYAGSLRSSMNIDPTSDVFQLQTTRKLKINTSSNPLDSVSISGMGIPVSYDYFAGRYYVATGINAAGNQPSGRIYRSNDSYPTLEPTTTFTIESFTTNPSFGAPQVCNQVSDATVFNNAYFVTAGQTSSNFVYLWAYDPFGSFGGSPMTGSFPYTYDWIRVQGLSIVGTSREGNYPRLLKVVPAKGRLYFSNGSQFGHVSSGGVITASGNGTIAAPANSRFVSCDTDGRTLFIGTMSRFFGKQGELIVWDTSDTSQDANYTIPVTATGVLAVKVANGVPYFVTSDGRLQKYDGGTSVSDVAYFPCYKSQDVVTFFEPNLGFIHHKGIELVDNKLVFNIRSIKEGTSDTFEEMPSGVYEFDLNNPNKGIYLKYAYSTNQSDYGQHRLVQVGALFETKRKSATLMAGARYYFKNGSTYNGIFYDDILTDNEVGGYFETVRVPARDIDETWGKLVSIQDKKSTSEMIAIKYRVIENPSYQIAITWTGTNTFTTTSTLVAEGKGDSRSGDEVTIVSGVGGGKIAHITTITGTSTKTVTLDKSIGENGTTGVAIVRNYKLLKENTDGAKGHFDYPAIGVTSEWLQLKLQYITTGVRAIKKILVNGKPRMSSS
jgi:hypothetical protein